MKPEYEKPTAVPLGEALKGSGECNAWSIVIPGSSAEYCYPGGDPYYHNCSSGTNPPDGGCSSGTQVSHYIIK